MNNISDFNYQSAQNLPLTNQSANEEIIKRATIKFSHELVLIIKTVMTESANLDTVKVMKKIILVISNQPDVINNSEKKYCFEIFSKLTHLFLLNAWPTNKLLPCLVIFNADEAKSAISEDYQACDRLWLYDLLDDFEQLTINELILRIDEIFNDLAHHKCGKIIVPSDRALRDELRLKIRKENRCKEKDLNNHVFF